MAEKQGLVIRHPPSLGNASMGSSMAEFDRDEMAANGYDMNGIVGGYDIGSPAMGKSKSGRRERPKNHTPRPSNSFILYRKSKHSEIMRSYKGLKALNNNFISKIVARWWKCETEDVKAFWSKRADEEKRAHMEKYPDYKYRPKKTLAKQNSSSSNIGKVERQSSSLCSKSKNASMAGMILPMSNSSWNLSQTPIAPAPQRLAPMHQMTFSNMPSTYSYETAAYDTNPNDLTTPYETYNTEHHTSAALYPMHSDPEVRNHMDSNMWSAKGMSML